MVRNAAAIKKTFVLIVAGLAAAAFAAATQAGRRADDPPKAAGAAGDKAESGRDKKPEPAKCPVAGEPVNFLVAEQTKDGPVYFCCTKCQGKYKESPDKYAKAVDAQRKACAALPRIQTTCPISGKPVDRKFAVEADGKKVQFCCPKCPEAYKKEPAKYAGKLEGCYTYQTKCPIMDEEIDPAVFITTKDGHKVYFCCDHCNPKFLKDPGKYTAKLAEAGIKLDPAKVK